MLLSLVRWLKFDVGLFDDCYSGRSERKFVPGHNSHFAPSSNFICPIFPSPLYGFNGTSARKTICLRSIFTRNLICLHKKKRTHTCFRIAIAMAIPLIEFTLVRIIFLEQHNNIIFSKEQRLYQMVEMSNVDSAQRGFSFIARRPLLPLLLSSPKEENQRKRGGQTSSRSTNYIYTGLDGIIHKSSRTGGGVHCLRGIVLFETGHSASLIITRPLEQLDLLQLYRTTSGIWYMYIHVSLLEEDAIQSLAAKTQIKYSTLYLRNEAFADRIQRARLLAKRPELVC